jgi:hypothetical protein
MEDQIQILKINAFLSMVTPVVAGVVRTILKTLDFQVVEQGHGFELVFSIKKGEKQAEFYLQNLLLEIATIDRDESPLRFDEKLRDFDYFLAKTCRLIPSKLNVLFHLFGEEDVDGAIENIARDAKQYERIRIWRFDQQEPDRKH